MSSLISYFRWSIFITLVGLVLAFWLGYNTLGTLSGAFSFFIICAVLAALEISLSFDNAIVNANKLQSMEPLWQKRFLTWGIIIAVFGMRIVFPLAVVAIAANINPWSAIVLAASDPQEYSRIMSEAHVSISAFGGTFLMMVALSYFVDQEKEVDWVRFVELRLRKWASIKGLEIAVVLIIVLGFTISLPKETGMEFLFAAIFGLVAFLIVELLGQVLDSSQNSSGSLSTKTAAAGGIGAFLYLEMLDASFSFDGVIGAFALTQNLFLIAIGLGIGAMYVRSMTIMLVEKQALAQLRYLEHGAFYSILALSVIMFAQSHFHIPEVVTGFIGVGLIGLSLYSSLRYNKIFAGDA